VRFNASVTASFLHWIEYSVSVGLIDVVPCDKRREKTYLVESHALLPAVVEHAESDVFMIHPITQSDLDNCRDPDAVSLCLLVVVNLEGLQISHHVCALIL